VPVRPLYETENNARAALLLGANGSNRRIWHREAFTRKGATIGRKLRIWNLPQLEPSDPDKQKLHDILEAVLRLANNMAKARW